MLNVPSDQSIARKPPGKSLLILSCGFACLLSLSHAVASQPLSSVITAEQQALSLPQAFTIALRDSPAVHNACDAAQGTRYEIDVAEAEFAPRLTPQSSSGLGADTETSQTTSIGLAKKFSTGTEVEVSSGTSASDRNFHRSYTGVTVSQSLWRGLGPLTNTANVVAAERRAGVAERQIALTKEQVVLDVATAFYRIVGQQLVLGVWQQSLEHAQQLLAAAEAKMQRGLATKIDVFRAQSQAATAESGLLDAQEALQEAQDALKVLLGRAMEDNVEVENQILPLAITQSEQELLATALRNRLEVQQATARVKDAEYTARVAERNQFPDVRVGFNYALTGRGRSFSDSAAFDDSKFRVLFSTSVPLDFSAARARTQQSRLEVRRQQRELAELEKKVTQEIRQAVRHVATVGRRIAVQEKNVQVTQANMELVNLRFERGYADLLEVLRAEDSLRQAQREQIGLRIEQVLTALQLRKAAGLLGPFLETLAVGNLQSDACPPPPSQQGLFE